MRILQSNRSNFAKHEINLFYQGKYLYLCDRLITLTSVLSFDNIAQHICILLTSTVHQWPCKIRFYLVNCFILFFRTYTTTSATKIIPFYADQHRVIITVNHQRSMSANKPSIVVVGATHFSTNAWRFTTSAIVFVAPINACADVSTIPTEMSCRITRQAENNFIIKALTNTIDNRWVHDSV